MPTPTLDAAAMQEAMDLVQEHGSVSAAARAAQIPVGTLQHRYKQARTWKAAQQQFQVDELPSELAPLSEILERRRREFKRVDAARSARKLIPVRILCDGPIGIAHFGDPHVDDAGTDIAKLEAHLKVINKTEGMFAGNVGDYTNNWVGRLAHLYSQQSTTAKEAWALADWLFNACPWVYLVGGNHDAWSGDRDPLKWIAKQAATNPLYEPAGCRLELQTPSGRNFRINARHDFKGHSQWNTAHGPSKAAQLGWRDHVLTCGHTHVSGYQVLKDPASGLISHILRVAAYKTHDKYATEMGFPDQNIFCCPVTIFNPAYGDDDPRQIQTLFDPETAGDYLKFLRRRKAA